MRFSEIISNTAARDGHEFDNIDIITAAMFVSVLSPKLDIIILRDMGQLFPVCVRLKSNAL